MFQELFFSTVINFLLYLPCQRKHQKPLDERLVFPWLQKHYKPLQTFIIL